VRSGARTIERPQAPALGWARRLLGTFHVTGAFWFRLPYWAMSWLRGGALRLAVLVFTSGFFVALRQIRAAIAANLEAVLGPAGFWERQRRLFRTFHAFAWCYAERYEALHYPDRFAVVPEGLENLQAAAGPGEGFIFVTAHVGHWETASHQIAAILQREAHVVREEEIDTRAQAFMQEILRLHGEVRYTTHFASDDPRLGLELAEALRQGHVVALQGDRPRAGGRTVNARLFGRSVELPLGPAALARTVDVALVPTFSFREGRHRYRVVFRKPIRVSRDAPRAQALDEAVERLAADIEWAIRQQPHQWFCFRKLWPDLTPAA
jgi:lauroyl/myristoyl acyltransferase